MEEVSIIGIDLAKRSFQVHGAMADGSVAYRKKLSRGKLLGFFASQPPCTVAMEAWASAHYWGREIAALGPGPGEGARGPGGKWAQRRPVQILEPAAAAAFGLVERSLVQCGQQRRNRLAEFAEREERLVA